MKTYPAHFVGETTYPEVYDVMRDGAIGDVMLVARTDYVEGSDHGPYLAIRCGCGRVELVAVEPYAFPQNGASWRLTSRDPVNVEPSIVSGIDGGRRCHYFVHGGELQMLDDTTAVLK